MIDNWNSLSSTSFSLSKTHSHVGSEANKNCVICVGQREAEMRPDGYLIYTIFGHLPQLKFATKALFFTKIG